MIDGDGSVPRPGSLDPGEAALIIDADTAPSSEGGDDRPNENDHPDGDGAAYTEQDWDAFLRMVFAQINLVLSGEQVIVAADPDASLGEVWTTTPKEVDAFVVGVSPWLSEAYPDLKVSKAVTALIASATMFVPRIVGTIAILRARRADAAEEAEYQDPREADPRTSFVDPYGIH